MNRHLVPLGVIYPPSWTVLKAPARVYTIYVHPSAVAVRTTTGHSFVDCLGQCCSDIGQVCSVGFKILSSAPATFRFWCVPRSQMPLGAAGAAHYADGWIAIASDSGNGRLWNTPTLIGIIKHEIMHKPQFGNIGWPGGHAPLSVPPKHCMDPWNPLPAFYAKTNEQVAQYGLCGFSRREADILAVRNGTGWLHWRP